MDQAVVELPGATNDTCHFAYTWLSYQSLKASKEPVYICWSGTVLLFSMIEH